MGDWSLGSVTDEVFNLVPDIPTAISGTTLLQMADRARRFVENCTGNTVGSNSIVLQYQGPVTNLTASYLTTSMQLLGADSGYKLGDFTKSNSFSNPWTGRPPWGVGAF